MSSADDSEQRRPRLIAAALSALVPDHDRADAAPVGFPGGAAIHVGGVSHIWLDDRPERMISVAVLLASRAGSESITVVLPSDREVDAGATARRAGLWRLPVDVAVVDGRSLRPVPPSVLGPERPLPPAHEAFRSLIAEAGADAIIEHGVLTGGVDGLEVCRVVEDDDGVRLEVGVGSHDREAFRMLHGETPALDSLTRIVAAVSRIRGRGADPHPLNRLAPERALRRRLTDAPSLVDAEALQPVSPAIPARGPGDAAPAHAIAVGPNGARLVACITGTDLGWAADVADTFHWLRDAHGLTGVTVAVPGRNRLPAVDELAALTTVPMSVVAVSNLP